MQKVLGNIGRQSFAVRIDYTRSGHPTLLCAPPLPPERDFPRMSLNPMFMGLSQRVPCYVITPYLMYRNINSGDSMSSTSVIGQFKNQATGAICTVIRLIPSNSRPGTECYVTDDAEYLDQDPTDPNNFKMATGEVLVPVYSD